MQGQQSRKILFAIALAILFILPGSYLVRIASTPSARNQPVMVAPANNFGSPTGLVAPSNLKITASIGLFDKTQSQTLQALLSGLYDPSSSLYHQFLTSSQYSDIFAPSATDYGSAVSYFQSYGLTTYTTQSRFFVNLEGTASQFSAALNTNLQLYTLNGLTFYENVAPLSLPQNIAQYTTSVIGMENFTFYVPHHVIQQLNPSGPIPPFAPPYQPGALEGAYNETGLLNRAVNGSGQTIVLIDAGYGDKFIQADISEFSLTYNLPNPIVNIQTVNSSNTIQDVQLDTANGVLAQQPGAGALASWDGETALDVEWSHSMAPGANLVNMISFDPGVGLDQAVATAIAIHSGNIISQSFGQWEGFSNITYAGGPPNQTDAGYVDPFYQMAAATGITVLASSGDSGSTSQAGAPSPSVNWPASDPWVTAVGGTTIKISNAGFWQGETAWTGSGGGFSTSYTRSSFETGPGLPVSGQYANARGVPDVAADADPNSGVVLVDDGINVGAAGVAWGGTSLASPLWAGVIATLESYKNTNFGFYSPTAYSILNSQGYKAQIQDVTSGSNGVYSAGNGWDSVTGIGSPNVGCLAYSCNPTANSGFGITSPATGALVGTTSVPVRGTHNLQPGNWLVGPANSAPGYLTGVQQNQLNILSAWIGNYNPTAGTFHAYMNITDLTNLTVPPAPSEGEWWLVQWTYTGGSTGYFAAMFVNIVGTSVNNQPLLGISFQYGTITPNPADPSITNYGPVGTITGSYTATAPGTIDLTVPLALVGNPAAGTSFTGVTSKTFETVGTPAAASLQNVDVIGSTTYRLGDPLLPAGFVQVSTSPSYTGAVNATLTNYPAINQWTANVNLAGLAPGPETLYAREVGNDGIVIQTTTIAFIYTVGLLPTAAITSIYMTNGNGTAQTTFTTGSTGVAVATVKNTGILTITGAYVQVQFTSSKGKTIFSGYSQLPSLTSGQSATIGLGTTFTKAICQSGVYGAQATVWNGLPGNSNVTQLANPKSTTFILSCHK